MYACEHELPQDKNFDLLAMCTTCVWWRGVHNAEVESMSALAWKNYCILH